MLQTNSYQDPAAINLQYMQETLNREKLQLGHLRSLLATNDNQELGELFRESVGQLYPELLEDQEPLGPEHWDMSLMTKEQFDAAIQVGIDDMLAGRVLSDEEMDVFLDDLINDYENDAKKV